MGGLRISDQIVFLYCSDLGKTAAFYEGLLGLELVVDQGSCRIVKAAGGGGGYLGYCERSGEGQGGAGVILTLVVPEESDVDDWYAYLSGCGQDLRELPARNPAYGIYHFFFEDPDGYSLEIQAFLDPGWDRPL